MQAPEKVMKTLDMVLVIKTSFVDTENMQSSAHNNTDVIAK